MVWGPCIIKTHDTTSAESESTPDKLWLMNSVSPPSCNLWELQWRKALIGSWSLTRFLIGQILGKNITSLNFIRHASWINCTGAAFRQTLVRHDTRPGPAVSNIPWDEWREHEEHISKFSNEDPLDTNPMCILLWSCHGANRFFA